eukprot:jgi/Chlat1/693/Chrsp104S00018
MLKEHALTWSSCFGMLLTVRLFSAVANIIHDCDETFNYWEPLHYLMHGYGLQTWEYSAEFGLRSYGYLLSHKALAFPAQLWNGDGIHKVATFYWLRAVLGATSAAVESALVVALAKIDNELGESTLLLLYTSAGMLFASTAFLPSTFAMYGITLAAACMLQRRPKAAIFAAAAGVLIGWPFAALAAAPIGLCMLVYGESVLKAVLTAAVAFVTIMVPSALADAYYYGRLLVSQFNLLRYNVAGGGDSSLYGVEGSLFYMRNAFNNFNLALPLALVFPLLDVYVRRYHPSLHMPKVLATVAPFYVWFTFMSRIPHKEERFMYVVYPLICVAAAGTIIYLIRLLQYWRKALQTESMLYQSARYTAIGVIALLSASRAAAILLNYGAPMAVYRHLADFPAPTNQTLVCVGSEWHRFPSSFFLPSPHHRLVFVSSGFDGLLPFPFNDTLGGTRAAPGYFNNQNKAHSHQFVSNADECGFFIDLQWEDHTEAPASGHWDAIAEEPFVLSWQSPALSRAFYVPWVTDKRLHKGSYRLLENRRPSQSFHTCGGDDVD